MKKLIELTPEWVLVNLSESMYVDDNGIMSVYTSRATDVNLILLALKTLKIPFEESEVGNLDYLTTCFEFKIEDIEFDCPSVLGHMLKLNSANLDHKLKMA